VQGVCIVWWRRALRKDGSTLAQLHYDWRSGTTLLGALTAGRHTGLLALACIFSTLVVIDVSISPVDSFVGYANLIASPPGTVVKAIEHCHKCANRR